MANQKIGKMRKHEMDETKAYEKAEERRAKEHFVHEGAEHIPEHRKQHLQIGKHAIDHREDTELYSPKF